MLTAIEYTAVISSALYGVLLAARKELDVIGSITLAFAIAFGGGTLRDLFLDRHPLFWIANVHFSQIVFVLAALGAFLPRLTHRLEPYLALPDALGLGLFSVLGALFAVEAGAPLFVASLMGVVTGTFGGVIGDVICNEIPRLFRPSPLYATCSFLGAWVYLILIRCAAPAGWAITGGIAVTVILRLIAVRRGWSFPAARLSTDSNSP